MLINWSGSSVSSDRVDQDMFGGNMLFDRDRVTGSGTFDDVTAKLGIEHVRYPGGSITEWYFDIKNPDAERVWDPQRGAYRDLTPLTEFLTWAGTQDVGVNLVVPTGSLMANGPQGARQPKSSAYRDVYDYITDVLNGKYGDARIHTIEIGNEYWLGAELTVEEYSRISNVMAEAIQDAIDAFMAGGTPKGWVEPLISIQVGQYGKFSTSPGWQQNQNMINWLTPEAADAVDAVVVHYYTRGYFSELGDFGYYFDKLDDWAARSHLRDIEFHVTEWNVNNQLSHELGLRQVSTMWYMFAEMLLRGVDEAYVWPVQQNNLTNLAGDEGTTALTVAGEAFRLLSEAVVGAKLVRRKVTADAASFVYELPGTTVVYVASRSNSEKDFSIRVSDLGVSGDYYTSVILGSDGRTWDPKANPHMELRSYNASANGTLTFGLDAFAALRLTFYDSRPRGDGVVMPDALIGTSYDDVFRAGDFGTEMHGQAGRDTITGGSGDDLIYGGDGDDYINAGNGDDTIFAGDGNDTVRGGDGRDLVDLGDGNDTFEDTDHSGSQGGDKVFGGAGNDRITGRGGGDSLSGDAGNDTISAGDGKDTVLAGSGDDAAWGGDGDDEIDGGSGNDTLSGGSGNDTLTGGTGNDRLEGDAGDDSLNGESGHDWLSGWTGNDLLIGAAGDDTLYGGTGNDTLSGGDGDDWLSGDGGKDVFIFDRDDGRDTISGFDGHDLIDLRGRGLAWEELAVTQNGDSAQVRFAGTTLVFTDLDTKLGADDFLFF